MSAAAVQGQEFDAAVVASVLGMDLTEVEERLESLDRTHGFVRLVDGRAFPDNTFTLRYTFVHVLYQNALYASLRPTRKVAWNAAVAQALLRYYGAQCGAIASELAMLFEAARDFERAADYFLAAAQQAAADSSQHGGGRARAARDCRRRVAAGVTRASATRVAAANDARPGVDEHCRLRCAGGGGGLHQGSRIVPADRRRASVFHGDLWPVSGTWLARADYRTCRELAEQLLRIAQKAQDSTLLIPAHSAIGNTLCFSADFEAARTHAEQLIAIYDPARHHALAALYSGFDLGVGSRGGLAVNLWALGYPDQAVRRADDAIALARDLSHASSTVLALNWAAMVHQHRRDAARDAPACRGGDGARRRGTWPHGWRGQRCCGAGRCPSRGKVKRASRKSRHGLAAWSAGGLACLVPYFLSLLSEAQAALMQTDAALSTLAEALAITERTREGYAEAELHRLRGELQADPDEADASFQQALDIARRQHAKSYELRAVRSLRRLDRKRNKRTGSERMLSEIYGWFTEGLDTIDLKEAALLLRPSDVG